MANARIDQNDRNTLTAYNETSGLIEPVRVDSVLDAVLVYGVPDAGGTFTAIDRAIMDENGRNTLSAWNDDTQGIEALRCSLNGDLLVIEA